VHISRIPLFHFSMDPQRETAKLEQSNMIKKASMDTVSFLMLCWVLLYHTIHPNRQAIAFQLHPPSNLLHASCDNEVQHVTSTEFTRLNHTAVMIRATIEDELPRILQQEQGPVVFTPFELRTLERVDKLYSMSQRVNCPFFRRRYGDALDHLDHFVRNILIRPSRRHALGPPQACKPVTEGGHKTTHLPIETVAEVIRRDWEGILSNRKGYYVTGRLSPQIYRDDCLFRSPDPDLPIRGLRKYMGVATRLFDAKQSSSELQKLTVLERQHAIQATWRMNLTIKLPWRPKLPTFTGTTTYRLDSEHLICCHDETWDLAVSEAFLALFVHTKSSQGTRTTAEKGTCPFSRFFAKK
jgi:hypothetical protein